MRWIAAGVKIASMLFALIAILMTVLYFVLGRPDQPPTRSAVVDYSRYDLHGKAGEYRMPAGQRALLTFSAHDGFQLYAIGDRRFARDNYLSRNVVPKTEEQFEWTTLDDETRELAFAHDDDGRVTGFAWRDGSTLQTATRIDSGYTQYDASWAADDIRLAGTAFVPAQARTGAVVIHGSGDSDRDNLWYLHFVMALVDNGIAVLLPDKRGSGRSGGDWRAASFEDLASDAVGGRDELARLARLAPARIGFVGISQGGMIAPLAAVRAGDTAFVINVVGGTVSPHASLAHETVGNLREMGLPSNFITRPWAMGIAKRRRPEWWDKNGDFDPMVYWRQVEAPVLMIFGRDDLNAPVEASLGRLEELLTRPDFEVRVFDDAGHALMNPDTREMLPEVLDGMARWAADR